MDYSLLNRIKIDRYERTILSVSRLLTIKNGCINAVKNHRWVVTQKKHLMTKYLHAVKDRVTPHAVMTKVEIVTLQWRNLTCMIVNKIS